MKDFRRLILWLCSSSGVRPVTFFDNENRDGINGTCSDITFRFLSLEVIVSMRRVGRMW